jgi:UDP-N-acetyl-D-glucosamine dehydrogenase
MTTVTIVGLGYVGLPLACLCARKGLKVFGLDVDSSKIESINKGKSPIDDDDLHKQLSSLKGKIIATKKPEECIPVSDAIIVCVPTPIDKKNQPDLKPLISASTSVAKNIRKGSIFIVESTIYPGTIEEVIVPILNREGLDASADDVLLAHCPERIDPGNRKWTIEMLPRVVGGITPKATKKVADLYRSILSSEVMELSSVKAAEATKIMENTFRDVNIAFINEMAMSFDKAGIDIIEVIRGASTKPFAFMPHYPGAGVGGHCIPVDPYYLIEKAKQIGFDHKFLSLARTINNNMPLYTIELLENELRKMGKGIAGAKVGVLGLAYKANVDDMRESPAIEVIRALREKKADVAVFDPHVLSQSTAKSIKEMLEFSDYLILVTDHREFKEIPVADLKKNGILAIIDGRNCLDKEAIKKLGIAYHGVGRS